MPITKIKAQDGPRRVVFSDLDGALLDEKTFEWTAARSVLARLRQAGIPLIFISSKTRSEIATLRAQLGNHHPFAAENGAVVVRPRRRDVVLGRPAEELEAAAEEIAAEAHCTLELLSSMTRRRAMEVTGLPETHVNPARRRTHSAPFLLHEGAVDRLQKAARARGMRVIPGRRLLQLVGDHDKGDAVREIVKDYPGAVTIGIGDGPNDVPLLGAVDLPIFQGPIRPKGLPPHAQLEPENGPAGWSHAIWKNVRRRRHVAGGVFG